MDKNLTHNHPVVKRLYLYVFVVTWLLLLTIGLIFVLQQQNQSSDQGGKDAVPKAMNVKKEGTMSLIMANPTATVGTPVTITVTANSDEKNIVAFDALLSYDATAFSQTSAATPLTGFQLFPIERGNHLTLTGSLGLTTNNSPKLSGDSIATITFTPKKAGVYTFTLMSNDGPETTKMVDDKSHKLFPTLSNLEVTIQ